MKRPRPRALVLTLLLGACGGSKTTGASGAGGAGLNDGAAGHAGAAGSAASGSAGSGSAGSGSAGSGSAGSTGAAGSASDAGASGDGPAGGVPTFVAVGYGGVRVRSLDLGKTWIDSQRLGGGGDDNYLLRTVAFGKGLFVALGWQVHTSPDGKTWTMRTKAAGQWMGGARFGNGMFVAAGGYGQSAYSLDGITWPQGGDRLTDAARSVAFGNGLWTARADSNHWWQTSTGQTWTDMGGNHTDDVVFCDGQFSDASACAKPVGRDGGHNAFGAGVWVGIRSDGKIERSEDGGSTWSTVYTASDALQDVAFGDAGP